MTKEEAKAILTEYNLWRNNDGPYKLRIYYDDPAPKRMPYSHKKITEALSFAIEYLNIKRTTDDCEWSRLD